MTAPIRGAADDDGEKAADDDPRGRRQFARHRGQDQREQDDGGAIVQQALALEQDRQPFGRADAAEQADHGDRIGRGDDGAEHEGLRPGESGFESQRPGHQNEDEGGEPDGRDHAGDGERQDGPHVAPKLVEVEVESRFEQESGQDDREQHLPGQFGRLEGVQRAQQQAGEHERHRVREPKAARGDRHGRRDHEQHDESGFGVGHAGTFHAPGSGAPPVDYRDSRCPVNLVVDEEPGERVHPYPRPPLPRLEPPTI